MIKNKKFLVTGSSRGIGKTITENLLNEGANVVGVSRNKSDFISENYEHVLFDLSKTDFIPSFFLKLLKTHDIDGLISNAGFGKFENIENFSPKQIQELININFTSHIMLTRTLIPYFKGKGKGYLIYIGSESSIKPSKFSSLYSACKFGLRGFVKSIRLETSNNNIMVSIVNPGIVKTSFYDNLKFEFGDNNDEFIEKQDVSDVVINILKMRPGTVIEEVNLSSMKKYVKWKK